MRFAAVFAGRTAAAASRSLRLGAGTTLPGAVAERLHPPLLRELSSELEQRPVAVTGTNGKTTTTKMLGDILEAAGHEVVRNDSGSNLRQGIASALVASARLSGGIRGDVAVLEVDEVAGATVLPDLDPEVVVVTNLSRDQLDRYGDLDALTGVIGRTLARLPRTLVVLNADDPQVVGLATWAAGPVVYYGIDADDGAVGATLDPSAACPNCASPVEKSADARPDGWDCPRCGAHRPDLNVAARHVTLEDGSSSFELLVGQERIALTLPAAGMHNVYNAVAAAAAASIKGADLSTIATSLQRFTPAFGRTERMLVEGHPVVLMLAKNPAGTRQALLTALGRDDSSPLAMVLNDNAADGTDISWIWDIDLEGLDFGDRQVVMGGTRAEELAVRMKYARPRLVPPRTESDPAEAVRLLARLAPTNATSYVIATYTAMLAIRRTFVHSTDRFSSLGVRLDSGV